MFSDMDRKKIIDEGILELYLLGELSKEDEILVRSAISSDPDLKAIFDELELTFEKMGMDNAISPPAEIKSKLKITLEKNHKSISKELPLSKQKAGTISPNFLVAASIAVLFALSTLWFYNRWRQSVESLITLESQTAILEERLSQLENNYLVASNKYTSINNPQVLPVVLQGNDKAPGSRAVIFVNHQDKKVMVNAQGLPSLRPNETYQLWADVEGEMINMGLLSSEDDLTPAIYISKAESFNITVEPAGGNDHPTVSNLIGNVYL
jgi:anti-sigma-K factor RskA